MHVLASYNFESVFNAMCNVHCATRAYSREVVILPKSTYPSKFGNFWRLILETTNSMIMCKITEFLSKIEDILKKNQWNWGHFCAFWTWELFFRRHICFEIKIVSIFWSNFILEFRSKFGFLKTQKLKSWIRPCCTIMHTREAKAQKRRVRSTQLYSILLFYTYVSTAHTSNDEMNVLNGCNRIIYIHQVMAIN